MFTIFRHTLSRSRGQILGWGIALAAYGAYLISFYDTLMEQQEVVKQLLEQYPPELMAFFGGTSDFFTPAGYLNSYFFSYMSLIIGIYALLAGSGLLASDEENGTLDLILAHPISRMALFMGRLAAFLLILVLILAITWLGFILTIPATSLEISPGQLVLPFLSLFAALAFFGMLALLLSMLLPSRSLASMVTGLILVASFFVVILATLDENLQDAVRLSPLYYYQGGQAVEGLNWSWFGGLMGLSLLFVLLAWGLFERRDIRVGGEGGWRISGLFRRKAQSPAR